MLLALSPCPDPWYPPSSLSLENMELMSEQSLNADGVFLERKNWAVAWQWGS